MTFLEGRSLLKTKYAPKPSNYNLLQKVRASKKVPLKSCKYLKPTTKLRVYQAVGTLHFLLLNRLVLGDSPGLGKTIQILAGYCYCLLKDPNLKLLIATPKSAVEQWCEEIEKFTTGLTYHAVTNDYGRVKDTGEYGPYKKLKSKHKRGEVEHLTGFKARKAQYDTVDANVLVCGYYPVQQDYKFLVENRAPNFMVGFDEVQEFKNCKAMKHLGADKISEKAVRVYGLSATVIKNSLQEAYNIYRVIVPGLFGGPTKFKKTYLKTKKKPRMFRGKKIFKEEVVGYKNLEKFRETIDPYFLIRKTREVADELPRLISKKIVLEMTSVQERLYKEALNGDIYRREVKRRLFEHQEYLKGQTEPSERDLKKLYQYEKKYEESMTPQGLYNSKMAALSYCQLVSNGPAWIREEGESSKEIEFRRLFDQELFTEKVIVFTRFKSGIPRLEMILDDLNLKHRKITGDVSGPDRKKARLEFSDPKGDINTIFITQAGSAALNLQAANIILFVDTPWSYGDLYQTIGRAQRIGSVYSHIHLMHMTNKKTIDDHVLKVLFSKKDLVTGVMGDLAEGSLEFSKKDEFLFKDDEGSIDALFDSVFKKSA